MIRLFIAAFFILGLPAIAFAQTSIEILHQDGTLVQLTPSLLANVARTSVQAASHGEEHVYAGYNLLEVLTAAGVTDMENLKGAGLRRVMRVSAADGYSVVFALSELDRTIGAQTVYLVDQEDGQPLPDQDGTWRLVVPSDKRPARWIRQINRIEIMEMQ